MSPLVRSLACILVAGVSLVSGAGSYSMAQGHGGGMGGGRMGGGGFSPPNQAMGNGMRDSNISRRESSGTVRGGVQLGPPGRWWDDKGYAKSLKLRPDQQTRMDSIFAQNRGTLLSNYQSLQQAQARMEELSKSSNPDEAALITQIDRVAQARAELEKANTHMLLQLRKEMDPEQLARLEKHQ